MADARVKDFAQEAAPDGTENFGVDKAVYVNAHRVTLSQVKTFVWKRITNAGLITTITDEDNWDDGTGDYTGSTVGLVAGDVYYDSSTQIKYEYDGVDLIRYFVNNIF